MPNPPILYVDLIRETRAYKDSLLRHGDDSPLLPDDRLDFGGLTYYPIDLRYRIVGQMHLYARQRQIEVPDTGGDHHDGTFWPPLLHLGGKRVWLRSTAALKAVN